MRRFVGGRFRMLPFRSIPGRDSGLCDGFIGFDDIAECGSRAAVPLIGTDIRMEKRAVGQWLTARFSV